MNRRINKCVTNYLQKQKKDIIESITDSTTVEDVIQLLSNYPLLIIAPVDYEKRQRIKNIVPLYERCKAKRANKQQCTRRKRENLDFCGTHIKGTPHGIMDIQHENKNIQQIDVWIQEINGINYYIDGQNNVYNPQDVYKNKVNPRCIHKYHKKEDGTYILSDL